MVSNAQPRILNQWGKPFSTDRETALAQSKRELMDLRRQIARRISASYDAAQTAPGNMKHWEAADRLDPHSAASPEVRRVLRSRSRYEVVENNPYLKGILLTICNDFVGKFPKLKITDPRLSADQKKLIQRRFRQWSKKAKLRRKLWRARMAKIADGETFFKAYFSRRLSNPVKLNFQVFEADMVSSESSISMATRQQRRENEIDGIRFDKNEEPLEYYFLNRHPGASRYLLNLGTARKNDGKWERERFVVHWYRQDRGWLRGIPETTPSLPLCALLRRYTLAVVRHKELAADFAAILETERPPGAGAYSMNENGDWSGQTDEFDTFPIEQGLFTVLPWSYKMRQLQAVPDGVSYDEFVNALLREITRPILSPFNISSGSSKDSNMASGILDSHIYKGGQDFERSDAEEEVLDKVFALWWLEALLVPGHIDDQISPQRSIRDAFQDLRTEPPEHEWNWDRIGLEHTDPQRVQGALEIAHRNNFLTDQDIQEQHHNRTLEEWREEIEEQNQWRDSVGLQQTGAAPPAPVIPGESGEGDDNSGDSE